MTGGLRRAGTAGSAGVGGNATRASCCEFRRRHNQRLPARGRPAGGPSSFPFTIPHVKLKPQVILLGLAALLNDSASEMI